MGGKYSHTCEISVIGYPNPIASEALESTIIESVRGFVVDVVEIAAPNDLVEFKFSVTEGKKHLRYYLLIISYVQGGSK